MAHVYRYLLIAIMFIVPGCWSSVPSERVYGTYVASYPYGKETLILNADGSYEQRIVVHDLVPILRRGSWSFDPKCGNAWSINPLERTCVVLRDFLAVDNGIGQLKNNWEAEKPGIAYLGVEVIWFHIVIGSGSDYAHVKQ